MVVTQNCAFILYGVYNTPQEKPVSDKLKRHNDKQRSKREARRNKTCAWCQKPWFDTTKRIAGKTCSRECGHQLGVSVRKSTGSYIRTEQQNRLMVESIAKLKLASGKCQMSAESKKRLSQIMKDRWSNPALRERMISASVKNLHGIHHTKRAWAAKVGCSYSYFKQVVNEQGFDAAKLLVSPEQTIIEKAITSWLDANSVRYTYNKFLPVDLEHQYRPDIVLDDHRLIIECDGLYWHSDAVRKDTNYHSNKQLFYTTNGYQGLFFRSNEILNKTHVVQSIIAKALELCSIQQTVHADQTTVTKLTTCEATGWFEENHLGCVPSSRRSTSTSCFALVYNNEIVAAMQVLFKTKSNELEIYRFAIKTFTMVPGGFSKLLSAVIKTVSSPKQVTITIDKRYESCQLQNCLKGFGFNPSVSYNGFSWTNGEQVIPRSKYPGNSGYAHKLYKIWDCGQQLWVKTHLSDS